MFVVIDYGGSGEVEIISAENGRIIIRPKFNGSFTKVCTVSTVETDGSDVPPFKKTKKQKGVFVSAKGHISTETFK